MDVLFFPAKAHCRQLRIRPNCKSRVSQDQKLTNTDDLLGSVNTSNIIGTLCRIVISVVELILRSFEVEKESWVI